MKAKERDALAVHMLAMADDEMILAHRNSEWTGHAPIIEEDIAFTNIALDEMGHAALWYRTHARLTGKDPETYPDELVFRRQAPWYRNVQMMELPKGDWAFSMLRQYLFDAYEAISLPRLTRSSYRPLAEVAAKVRAEEIYHLRHTQAWVRRLGLGTEESQQRTQRALDELWGYALQLFEPLPETPLLVAAGFVPDPSELRRTWLEGVTEFLGEAGLRISDHQEAVVGDRSQHGEALMDLLAEMQHVAMAYPEVEW